MYKKLLQTLKEKPPLFQTTTKELWDDEYLSHSMLKAHLEPAQDGASRRYEFIQSSVLWLKNILGSKTKTILDLGCGPGLYAELLAQNGYQVTGIDFSRNSISYAQKSAAEKNLTITYLCQDYLTLEYKEKFDCVLLIYCDFGALAKQSKQKLLKIIWQALKPEGYFIFDVFTPLYFQDFPENLVTEYQENGFWASTPYLCLKRQLQYPEDNFLEQYNIITQNELKTYNVWNHAFKQKELTGLLQRHGFGGLEFYSDATGQQISPLSATLCAVAQKNKET